MRLRFERLVGGLAAIAAALAFATPAMAQDWLADRKRAEGAGIRLGDFELHPGIGIEGGYDSNLFLADGNAAGNPIVGSGLLRVTPHLFISTVSQQREAEGEGRGGATEGAPTVQFRGGLSASYYAFFADEARNNVGVDGDLNLVILPERPFSIILHQRFTRTVRPFTEQRGGGVGDARIDFGRNENDAGIDFAFGTPSRVLTGRVGYALVYNFFDGDQFQFANSLTHKVTGGASFRFLPQTAFVYDFDTQYRVFPSFSASTASALVTNGLLLRTRVGINGAITNTLSVSAMVGYAGGWFDVRDDIDSFVAQAELRWQATTGLKMAFGYDRNFTPSYVGNFMRNDRTYLNAQLLIGGSFLVGAEASLGFISFGVPVAADGRMELGTNPDGSTTRSDIRLSTSAFAEYRFTNWLGLNATLRYTGDYTDYRYSLREGVGTAPVLDPAGYNKFEGWLGLRAFY
jgi:hypothetical protein